MCITSTLKGIAPPFRDKSFKGITIKIGPSKGIALSCIALPFRAGKKGIKNILGL
jgi:hypothetical protein